MAGSGGVRMLPALNLCGLLCSITSRLKDWIILSGFGQPRAMMPIGIRGDQYVDIVGRDVYNKETADCVSEYTSIAENYGNKIVSLSECGTVDLFPNMGIWCTLELVHAVV